MIQFNNIEEVKAYAKQLLEKTDYTVLADVNLTNKQEFITYRNTVRISIFYPSINVQFPQEPDPIWGSSVNTVTSTQPNTDIPTA